MLHETCLLVSMSISLPPQTKIAKVATEEVEIKYKTAKNQGRVTKQLFSKEDIQPLNQAMTRARAVFNEITLPYDSAYRVLPASHYFEFSETMRELSNTYDKEKQNFLDAYEGIMARALGALGELFDANDYPSPAVLGMLMNFSIETSVIPSSTAFDELAGLTPEAVELLKKEALEGQQKKIEEALGDLFKRLFTSLSKASSRLKEEDATFHGTLIDNIHGAVKAVESLNLTNNQELIDLAKEVTDCLEGITPEDLRKDKELRAQKAAETQALVDKMRIFF